jgi:hypothetical protein
MLVAELSKISIRLFIHEGRFDLCFVRTFYTNMGGQKSDQTFVKLFVHKGYFDLYFLFVLIFFVQWKPLMVMFSLWDLGKIITLFNSTPYLSSFQKCM